MFARKFFVLAPRFHGATLLARLLDSHPLAVCLGDTYPSNNFDQICGCGVPVSSCLFWQAIKAEVDAMRYLDSPQMLPMHPRLVGGSNSDFLYRLPISILKRIIPSDRGHEFVSDYRRFVTAVYGQFADERPTVFVDGVKSMRRVKALVSCGERIDGILHVVRDPADFVKSTMDKGSNGFKDLVGSAYAWRREHREIEGLKSYFPYLRVSYDDICENSDATLRRIFDYMALPPLTVSELRQHSDRPWHFMGNASMFHFDWTIRAKRYVVSKAEKYLIDSISRPTTI